MAGSGKYVAIAAGNTQDPYLSIYTVRGIVFGENGVPYCRIEPKYISSSGVVTGTALSIEPGAEWHRLLLSFPNLTRLDINGYTGKTTTITVVDDVNFELVQNDSSVDYEYHKEVAHYKPFTFHHGLLDNVSYTPQEVLDNDMGIDPDNYLGG